MLTRRDAAPRQAVGVGFASAAVRWFLGLSGLYVLYASGTFFGLDDDFRMVNRLGMMLGSTTALSLLVAPASFAAAALGPIFQGRDHRRVRRQIVQLALLALGAYTLYGLGPKLSSGLLSLDSYPPPEMAAASRIVESARFWVPSTIAVFTVLAGVAGELTSRVTEWWNPERRITITWLSCLGLFLSFWVPFLLTANLILNRDIAPAWILPASLLLPIVLIAGTVWQLADDLRLLGVLRRPVGKADSYDPRLIDHVDRAVNPPVGGSDEPPVGAVAATRAELEMIHLAKGLRSVVGPSANLSPQHLDEIVNNLLDAPQTDATKPTIGQRARDQIAGLATVGQFCTNWACLALVLLMVGMLGGVPPNLALAGLAGLLGSVVIRTTAAGRLSMAR
jgi:hypothetical protein